MPTADFAATRSMLLAELDLVLKQLNPGELDAALVELRSANRIFTIGAGRSKLALQMAAMRFMHLGRTVFVVGETVTPAIGAGDLLLAASASGTTSTVVHAAQVAQKAGASILSLTAATDSPLNHLSTTVLRIPAASKADVDHRKSDQYAGSLFEQSVLLTADLLFHMLWKQSGQTAEELLTRHANLE